MTTSKKSGFVTLVGRSNVGKSTLLNALIGTKVAIVTPRPQTTREPVRGIFSEKRGQLVFVDTPGVFLGKRDVLSQHLNTVVDTQLEGIDTIVYVVDPGREPGPEEEMIQQKLRALTTPIVLVINKSDLTESQRPFLDAAREIDVGQLSTLEISALRGTDVNRLVDTLFALVPEGEPHYPVEQRTDLTHPRWLAELIREKCCLHLREEVPYSIHVEVQQLEERNAELMYAAAMIFTSDERYKRMVIGAGGSMLKAIGSDVRKEWQASTNRRLYLDLQVSVDPKWMTRVTQQMR
jgi:GTP-binding protein Era